MLNERSVFFACSRILYTITMKVIRGLALALERGSGMVGMCGLKRVTGLGASGRFFAVGASCAVASATAGLTLLAPLSPRRKRLIAFLIMNLNPGVRRHDARPVCSSSLAEKMLIVAKLQLEMPGYCVACGRAIRYSIGSNCEANGFDYQPSIDSGTCAQDRAPSLRNGMSKRLAQ